METHTVTRGCGMETHTVSRADGPALNVVETGPADARPLVFVHGYSQCHLSWTEQFEGPLAEEYRLVGVDLRGHGESEKPREGYDDGRYWAADLAAVFETLDLTDAVLVGWSYGSLVVLDYLAAHGTDRVAGLDLVGVVPGIGTETTNGWLGERYVDLFPDIVSTDAETSVDALSGLVDLCVHDPDTLSTPERYRMLGYSAVVPPYVRDGMRDRSVSHLDLLDSLDVPTLLTHGEHDAVVSVEAAREAARRLPDATLSVYADCGHSPFLEASERFDRELRAFVEGL